mmetsp:Transcript_1478/g.5595  ORF Transcript_1478/g.5595 Transcript_1478/m.5595 type:complete len:202 (+) Transcript_1478:1198-1803(+)
MTSPSAVLRWHRNAACTSSTPSGWSLPSLVAGFQNILLELETSAKASGGERDEAMCSRISSGISHIDTGLAEVCLRFGIRRLVTVNVPRVVETWPKDGRARFELSVAKRSKRKSNEIRNRQLSSTSMRVSPLPLHATPASRAGRVYDGIVSVARAYRARVRGQTRKLREQAQLRCVSSRRDRESFAFVRTKSTIGLQIARC